MTGTLGRGDIRYVHQEAVDGHVPDSNSKTGRPVNGSLTPRSTALVLYMLCCELLLEDNSHH